MSGLMQGKRGLIMGVANDHSIAWGIAQALSKHGAELAFTYQGEALAKRVKPKGIELRPESYGWSVIQALLSRSDRRLAPVISAARGSHESLGGWKKAYRQVLSEGGSGMAPSGPEPSHSADTQPAPPAWEEIVHTTWSQERVLPWGHLQGAVSATALAGHAQTSLGKSPAHTDQR
mgnify:CR=1 FL=1